MNPGDYRIKPQPIYKYDPEYHVSSTYDGVFVTEWGEAFIGYVSDDHVVGYEGGDGEPIPAPPTWENIVVQSLPGMTVEWR